ncbi:hypothetical protein BE221DRAFT_71149 [Ostreococcus tauri]|uniref:Uncharacterized protein n=1 Tax=Ostreococcus tauri TaxID=70448 RepID=A0A1Y5IKU8_OSTTA|nr:hypothetical protein BE221DRAFT_71149 [Ostreococcus tauri]
MYRLAVARATVLRLRLHVSRAASPFASPSLFAHSACSAHMASIPPSPSPLACAQSTSSAISANDRASPASVPVANASPASRPRPSLASANARSVTTARASTPPISPELAVRATMDVHARRSQASSKAASESVVASAPRAPSSRARVGGARANTAPGTDIARRRARRRRAR